MTRKLINCARLINRWMVAMGEQRFEVRRHCKGFWSVMDLQSSEIASYCNLLMLKLRLDEADAFAALLNEHWEKITRPTREIQTHDTARADIHY